jgi:hypothetical protein
MFIYFKLLILFLNPFIQLERYNNYTTLEASDLFLVKRYSRSKKLLAINVVKSTGIQSHKQWYFRPRFR